MSVGELVHTRRILVLGRLVQSFLENQDEPLKLRFGLNDDLKSGFLLIYVYKILDFDPKLQDHFILQVYRVFEKFWLQGFFYGCHRVQLIVLIFIKYTFDIYINLSYRASKFYSWITTVRDMYASSNVFQYITEVRVKQTGIPSTS